MSRPNRPPTIYEGMPLRLSENQASTSSSIRSSVENNSSEPTPPIPIHNTNDTNNSNNNSNNENITLSSSAVSDTSQVSSAREYGVLPNIPESPTGKKKRRKKRSSTKTDTHFMAQYSSSSQTSSSSDEDAYSSQAEDSQAVYGRERVKSEFEFEPITLSWDNITYSVQIDEFQTKYILKEVSGYVRPGESLAILGPSGAGKSTLLDILAQKLTPTKNTGADHSKFSESFEGTILVNGQEVTPNTRELYKRICGYSTHDDYFIDVLTVKETLHYYAHLKLPRSMPSEQKERRVDYALRTLDLSDIANTKIGSSRRYFFRGISAAQKRRLGIATELVSTPPILFFDEPTAGLDAKNSQSVMDNIFKLKSFGHTVVCSLHQPRAQVLAKFDKLLLLSKGQVVYYGSVRRAIEYFTTIERPPPQQENPADFYVDLVTPDSHIPEKGQQIDELIGLFQRSQYYRSLKSRLADLPNIRMKSQQSQKFDDLKLNQNTNIPEASPFSVRKFLFRFGENIITLGTAQELREFSEAIGHMPTATDTPNPIRRFVVLLRRDLLTSFRDPLLFLIRIVFGLIVAMILGTVFFDLSKDQSEVQDRVNALFYVLVGAVLMSVNVLPQMVIDRQLYIQEHRRSMYSALAFVLANTIAILPLCLIYVSLYSILVAALIGLQTSLEKFLYFILMVVLAAFMSESVCVVASCIGRSFESAFALGGILVQAAIAFGGFLASFGQIPNVFRFFYWMSFFQYSFTGLMINEFEGREFSCGDLNSTLCEYPTGESVLEEYDIDTRDKWLCVAACAVVILVLRAIHYIVLKFFVK